MRNEREGFKLLGFVKGRLTLGLLRRGYDVLLSDADTVWLGDPWPWIGRGTGEQAVSTSYAHATMHFTPPIPPPASSLPLLRLF